MGVPMRRLNAIALAAIVAAFANPALADVTAFEGVRLIVGNGNVVENATLVIDGNKIVQAGQGVAGPARAARGDPPREDVGGAVIAQPLLLPPPTRPPRPG